jgi:hypothetical protein
MTAACPHCMSEAPGAGDFCADCGKALPTGSGPRILGAKEFATSTTGQAVQSDELKIKARAAFSLLLLVGIFQLINGGVNLASGMNAMSSSGSLNTQAGQTGLGTAIFGGIFICTGLTFIGLSIWARFQPLPAAIVGLCLYSLIFVGLLLLMLLAGAFSGNIFFRILVIAALAKAVQAGFQHRELKRRLAAQGNLPA